MTSPRSGEPHAQCQLGGASPLERGPEFVEDYLEFLAAGGSTRPDELVRRLGMDITDPGFWDAGLTLIDEQLSAAEKLAEARPSP